MKISTSIKYRLFDYRKAVIIFWGIVFMILAATAAIGRGSAEIRGMEMATAIFMFVSGLNSFKPEFNFFIANGVSRRTQFASFAAAAGIVSLAMVAVDMVFRLIFTNFMPYMSLFVQIYYEKSPVSYIESPLSALLWPLLLYVMLTMLGYMISLIYYRSSAMIKLAVSIAPPVLLFFLFRYIDPAMSGGITHLIGSALGLYPGQSPYSAIATFLCCALLFAAAAYLLMRRAEIKKQ